ncbi:hypothetical protein DFH94DRAFT_849284 [Russula ochroleuca]|uniref:Uncharacterized protein n=1 Tax=Russula ochroleuca TaxID=152965 RepID=A0A9P5JU77_9AGAM|nr:hypothetical protein DFH94DRAFT_849284 [Russula ochroleuca]
MSTSATAPPAKSPASPAAPPASPAAPKPSSLPPISESRRLVSPRSCHLNTNLNYLANLDLDYHAIAHTHHVDFDVENVHINVENAHFHINVENTDFHVDLENVHINVENAHFHVDLKNVHIDLENVHVHVHVDLKTVHIDLKTVHIDLKTVHIDLKTVHVHVSESSAPVQSPATKPDNTTKPDSYTPGYPSFPYNHGHSITRGATHLVHIDLCSFDSTRIHASRWFHN